MRTHTPYDLKRQYLNEEPFFIRDGQKRLFAVLHRPEGAVHVDAGVVFCNPFAGEQSLSHRVLVNFARLLSAHGFYVMRFDYSGCGSSAGESADATIQTYVSDTKLAIDTLLAKVSPKRIGLLGLRLGAPIAAMTSASAGGVDFLVHWAPVTDVRRYFEGLLRGCLATQLVRGGNMARSRSELRQRLLAGEKVNVAGYFLNGEIIRWADSFDIVSVARASHRRCLLVYMSRKTDRSLSAHASFCCPSLLHSLGCRIVRIAEDQFWQDLPVYRERSTPLYNETLKWLHSLVTGTSGGRA